MVREEQKVLKKKHLVSVQSHLMFHLRLYAITVARVYRVTKLQFAFAHSAEFPSIFKTRRPFEYLVTRKSQTPNAITCIYLFFFRLPPDSPLCARRLIPRPWYYYLRDIYETWLTRKMAPIVNTSENFVSWLNNYANQPLTYCKKK